MGLWVFHFLNFLIFILCRT